MATVYPGRVESVAVVGLGTIGMSWTAYFLARGISVRGTDIDPHAEARARDYIGRATPELERLGLVVPAGLARFSFHVTVEDAVDGVSFVQENGPEMKTRRSSCWRASIARCRPRFRLRRARRR